MHHIFILKLLVMCYLPHECILIVGLTLKFVVLNEMIYEISGMTDLLFAHCRLFGLIIRVFIKIKDLG